MQLLPELQRSIKNSDPVPRGMECLIQQLENGRITVHFRHDKRSVLRGVGLVANGTALKGQEWVTKPQSCVRFSSGIRLRQPGKPHRNSLQVAPLPLETGEGRSLSNPGPARRRLGGWLNVVNPFRTTTVFGTPGSDKSSLIKEFIR